MPFFGIPIRNGLPIGLGSVAGFGVAPEFSPADLFLGGVNGAWYDPSDSSTLFSDTAGTTPCAAPGAGAQVVVGRMLDKSGNANHAQAYNSTTARPELSARVNLLTYSEQFDNAAWFKANLTITAGGSQITAPDGTVTADFLTVNAGSSTKLIRNSSFPAVAAGVQLTGTVCFKAGTHNFFSVSVTNTTTGNIFAVATVNLATGQITKTGVGAGGGTIIGTPTCTSLGDGWFRVSLTATYPSGTAAILWVFANSSATPTYDAANYGAETWNAAGTETGYLWGADLRPANIGSAVPAYQRIADQYTYDNSASFPRYLRFDGVDDGMSTPANLNLSSTDKATVFAGVRKLSDAAAGMIVENFDTTPGGVISLSASPSSTAAYFFRSAGTADSSGATPTSYAAPISNVLTGIGEISTDVRKVRVNGVEVVNSSTDQGTGNYANRPITIGYRSSLSLWLNGQLYSLIVVGAATDASTISATETWVANETGISIFDNGPSLGLDFTAQTYQVWEV